MKRDTSNTYVYRFKDKEQKGKFKIAVTKEDSNMQDKITEALEKGYPKIFKKNEK